MARSILREPLIHFIVVGLMLYGLNQFLFESRRLAESADAIVVDQVAVVQFIQHRQNLAPADALAQWRRLPKSSRTQVVKDLVEEEALYRKAKAFGLDESDYVIRRRLVQKMDFAASGLTEAEFTPSDVALVNYYDTHQGQFSAPAQITFTHVYFETKKRESSSAVALATQQLKQLNATKVSFSEGGQYGQRFAYHRNYVDRAKPLIMDHFGSEFAAAVFGLQATPDQWQGPLASRHGVHLVLISALTPKRALAFSEVKAKIVTNMRLAEQRMRSRGFLDALLAEYSVQIDPSLGLAQ